MTKKVSVPVSNNVCPQTLFLYGTYKEDGTPNFGLFCWFGYCWDGGLHVMAAIGAESRKLTPDRIRAGGVFSANMVSESMLPLADYFGNTEGYDPHKMNVPVEVIPGEVLPVPVLAASPWSYELEVVKTVPLDGSEVFICKIRNVLADEALADENVPAQRRMALAAPVLACGMQKYFTLNPAVKGSWGDWKDEIKNIGRDS